MTIKRLDHINFVTKDMPATIHFYCDIIGLVRGKQMQGSAQKVEYFYIDGQERSVLHVEDATSPKMQPSFHRFADPAHDATKFSTSPIDHFCLLMDFTDYEMMLERVKNHNLNYETYCHDKLPLKQIWVFDPNGIRVELQFLDQQK